MIHHLYTVGHVTSSLWSSPLCLWHKRTHRNTLHTSHMSLYKVIITSPLAHIYTLLSHTSPSLSLCSHAHWQCYLLLLGNTVFLPHILIAICTSSIHQFSSSSTCHLTHQFTHSLDVFPCLLTLIAMTYMLSSGFQIERSSLNLPLSCSLMAFC